MTDRLDALLRIVDRISRLFAWAGGAILIATTLVIIAEIILRGVFSYALGLGFEMSGYTLAVCASWSFAYALFRKAHIRIDALYVRLGKKARIGLDLVALAAFTAFAILIATAAVGVMLESLERGSLSNTPLKVPLWIPQLLWSVGLVWFAFAMAVLLLRVVVALVQGDDAQVQKLAGSSTLDEQIEEEAPELGSI